jgi:ribosome-associated protein
VLDDESNSTAGALRLDHFVKLKASTGTGGQAKLLIQNGEVKVNGAIETRRRRKLIPGDVVEVGGTRFKV